MAQRFPEATCRRILRLFSEDGLLTVLRKRYVAHRVRRPESEGTPAERMTLPVVAHEHILAEKDGREKWVAHVGALSQAFALCPTEPYAVEIRDDVAFLPDRRDHVAKILREWQE